MAVSHYLTGDPEVMKLWAKYVQTEALKSTQMFKYFGDDERSLGVIQSDTQKGAGDRVSIPLRMRLTGAGVTELMPQEGNEEALVTHVDSVTINELSHATRRHKGISDQRVPWDVGMQMATALTDWWAERWDETCFNHLCGYTPVTDERYVGFNSVVAPSSGRHLWCSEDHTSDQTLDSDDVFSLVHIDRAREIATTGGSGGLVRLRPIKAAMANGGYGDMYVCFLHPIQVRQLRTSSTQTQWQDIQNALLNGGYIKDNPLFTGALGVYNKTVLVESEFITQGVHSGTGAAVANTRRAVFCGAQALGAAFGKGFGPQQAKVTEELFDYQREVGQNLLNIFGIKKSRWNSVDYGTIVLSSYAAPAA